MANPDWSIKAIYKIILGLKAHSIYFYETIDDFVIEITTPFNFWPKIHLLKKYWR